jgi:hypothetical protein
MLDVTQPGLVKRHPGKDISVTGGATRVRSLLQEPALDLVT